MVRITLELLRKRCEHNDGLIHNLEELSLHQDNLEEIDNIGQWCKDLKILYLQGNTIPKIENLNRLKGLEYLNLALNNIERMENLQGCESLKKLDLTANFIGDLTSVENLRNNGCLEDLFLTGNPCASYEGYREYVVAALPHLRILDGQEITRTERMKALQEFIDVKAKIIKQQVTYKANRDREKTENTARLADASGDAENYQECDQLHWSPEYRREMAKQRETVMTKTEEDRAKSRKTLFNSAEEKRPVQLFGKSGEALNVNEARLEFSLVEDEKNEQIVLTVSVYRHLDTSMIAVDVNPTFVRIVVKGKILQLRLPDAVSREQSTVNRSKASRNIARLKKGLEPVPLTTTREEKKEAAPFSRSKVYLEVDDSVRKRVVIDIHKNPPATRNVKNTAEKSRIHRTSVPLERPNSSEFTDNAEVPPLR